MKSYYKECKNTKQINSFLKKLGLEDFGFDDDYFESDYAEEFDFDSWINDEQTKGVSINVTTGFEVFATKYTKKDIDMLEREVC